MNQTEAVQLVTYLNRGGLLQALEGQAAVWADALDDIRFTDAQAAARKLLRTRTGADRWVTPGDIRYAVATIRRERIESTPTYLLDPPKHPELEEWQIDTQWRGALRTAIADGHDIETADKIACEAVGATRSEPQQIATARPVAALVEQTANAMPRIPGRA